MTVYVICTSEDGTTWTFGRDFGSKEAALLYLAHGVNAPFKQALRLGEDFCFLVDPREVVPEQPQEGLDWSSFDFVRCGDPEAGGRPDPAGLDWSWLDDFLGLLAEEGA